MKAFMITLLLLVSSGIGFAQTVQAPVTADQKAEEVVTQLKTDLILTDDQVPKVKAITVDRINKVTEARKKYGADKQRIQSANKLIQTDWENQLKGIVTMEQYNRYVETKGR